MEKERNEGKTQASDLENESTESPTIRHENTEKSDSFPPQEKTNTNETNTEEGQSPPSEESENEGESGETTEEPSPPQGRVTELEQQLEQSEAQRHETEERLAASQKSLAEAVSRYRTMLLEGTPEAPESMVVGETVDEIDRSFAEAKAMVQQVRREVEQNLAKQRLPAGSPTRTPANFSALTPIDKIRHALTR